MCYYLGILVECEEEVDVATGSREDERAGCQEIPQLPHLPHLVEERETF